MTNDHDSGSGDADKTRNQPMDLSKEVIQYLSKEIETTSNSIMTFRTKIAFAVLVGPFLVLGSFLVAARSIPVSFQPGALGKLAIAFEGLCFLTIAYVCARIEGDGWRQCAEWRRLIAALHKNPAFQIDNENLWTIKPTDSVNNNNALTRLRLWLRKKKLICAYLIAYFIMFASLVAGVFIISRVEVLKSDPPPSSPIAEPTK